MNARNAPPMKKRAKGSRFLSALFLSAFCVIGYFVWSSVLQYQTYGVIEGRLISVSAPWDGTVNSWMVREGDVVVQGQILAKISNLEMSHELAGLQDELKMNQALLEAEISKIKFDVQDHSDRTQKAVAEYLQSHGELLAEQATLEELDRKFERTKRLLAKKNVARSEFEKIYFQLAGQKKKIRKLEDAVDILKLRSTEANLNKDNGSSRLKPILAKIDLTQSKIGRIRERIGQGEIKAPASGRISRRYCLTGESSKTGEPIIEILEDNSIEAVLYVPQRIVEEFDVGKEIAITLEPYDSPFVCTVDRLGNRFEEPPASLKMFYRLNQPLLPVYLRPNHEAAGYMASRVGGTIKRPYEYKKAVGKIVSETRCWLDSLQDHYQANTETTSHQSQNQNDHTVGATTIVSPATIASVQIAEDSVQQAHPAIPRLISGPSTWKTSKDDK
jgi:multidrug resistance efflux pump